jgi:hypothetical protein
MMRYMQFQLRVSKGNSQHWEMMSIGVQSAGNPGNLRVPREASAPKGEAQDRPVQKGT